MEMAELEDEHNKNWKYRHYIKKYQKEGANTSD
jgi:hypothetical protein